MAARKPARGTGGKSRKSERNARSPRARHGLLRSLVYWSMIAVIWLVIALFGLVVWYSHDLPDVKQLGLIGDQPSVTLLAADGSEIVSFGDLRGEAVRLGELPATLPQAVLATEDRRFYSHFGLDAFGLARAMWANIRAGRIVQGGSTISQQLAKNLFLTSERTLKRKIQEVLLALWLEYEFSKDQILALYLNRVYFGAGTYGVEAASQKYFGSSARHVDLLQSAILAGLLQAPSRLAPTKNVKGARERAGVVLDNMVEAGYLTQAEADRTKRSRLVERPRRPVSGGRYFADWVLEQVPDYVGRKAGDLVVVTTLEPALQSLADKIVGEVLSQYGAKHRMGQAALLAMTPDGAVLAMIGGRDYQDSQFNRAVQAQRQPGSAFKPIVYLAGLESGLGPETVFEDRPIEIDGWRPRNVDGRFHGRVSMREGLARSINTIAVQVSEYVGRGRVIDTARRLGIASELAPHPSLALGTNEVGVMELTSAYAVFANGGRGVLPFGIQEIRAMGGRVLYRRRGGGLGAVVAARPLRQLQSMMEAVIDEGSGQRAEIGRPVAGKTGTTQNARDAWFVGFTGQMVTGVWLGNDDASPMRDVSGGGFAARIWRDFMRGGHQGLPVVALREPAAAPEADDDGRAPVSVTVTVDVGGFIDRIWKVLGGSEPSRPERRESDYPDPNVN